MSGNDSIHLTPSLVLPSIMSPSPSLPWIQQYPVITSSIPIQLKTATSLLSFDDQRALDILDKMTKEGGYDHLMLREDRDEYASLIREGKRDTKRFKQLNKIYKKIQSNAPTNKFISNTISYVDEYDHNDNPYTNDQL
jgi:hypothetical protein